MVLYALDGLSVGRADVLDDDIQAVHIVMHL